MRDAHRIRSAPFPSSYAKAQARAHIAALAQRGAPDVTLLVEHGRSGITLPTQTVRSQVLKVEAPAAIAFAETPDAVAFCARAFGDVIINRIDALIDEAADDAHALDHSERQKAEAEVLADLLSLERERRRKGSQPSTEPTVVRKPLRMPVAGSVRVGASVRNMTKKNGHRSGGGGALTFSSMVCWVCES